MAPMTDETGLCLAILLLAFGLVLTIGNLIALRDTVEKLQQKLRDHGIEV